MKIAKNTVVRLEYTLKDDDGEVLDESDGDPLEYLHGQGQLVPGLERALEGKGPGDKLAVKVLPVDGYGEHDPQRVVEVSLSELPEDLTPELGMELNTEGPDGEAITLWITEVRDDTVTLDGNHPLAGQNLNFAIEVLTVRQATPQELQHGHAHGEHGHDH